MSFLIDIKLQKEKNAKDACISWNIPFLENVLVYEARENGNPLGICSFTISEESGVLSAVKMIREGMASIADGLIRSALGFMWRKGIAVAESSDSIDHSLLTAIGFKIENGIWRLKLCEEVFLCCHEKNMN